MTSVYRAAIVAVATFVSAGRVPRAVDAAGRLCRRIESHGRLRRGLVASLLSLVLSLLIRTSHGQYTAQQSQLQTIAS